MRPGSITQSPPRRLGYGRVSTEKQSQQQQQAKLKAADCEVIRTEQISSGKAKRPQLEATLADLQQGDTLVVVKLDRLARSLRELLEISSSLQEKGADLVVLDQAIDTSTPAGRLMFNMLGAIGEFERELAIERTRDSVAHRKATGANLGGRPKTYTEDQARLAKRLFEEGQSRVQIGKNLNLGRMTVARILEGA